MPERLITIERDQAEQSERQELLHRNAETLNGVLAHPYAWSALEPTSENGVPLFAKIESRNPTGAYKWRGSYHAISKLPEGSHIVGASAGNHMRGLVDAVLLRGHQLTGYVPAEAPSSKLKPLLQAQADHPDQIEIILTPGGFAAATAASAADLADHPERTEVHPFAQEDVFVAQGTVMTEALYQLAGINEDCLRAFAEEANLWRSKELMREAIAKLTQTSQPLTFFVPMGGGGLITGMALEAERWRLAARRYSKQLDIRLIGVQMEGSNALTISAESGKLTSIEITNTLADGTAVAHPRQETLHYITNPLLVHGLTTVTPEEVRWSMQSQQKAGLGLFEGAGALARAGLNQFLAKTPSEAHQSTFITINSGGNVDPSVLSAT